MKNTVRFQLLFTTILIISFGCNDEDPEPAGSSLPIVWQKQFSSGRINIDALELDPSGNLYMAGDFANFIDLNETNSGFGDPKLFVEIEGVENSFLAKFDKEGNPVWLKSKLYGTGDLQLDLVLDGAGNFFAFGTENRPSGLDALGHQVSKYDKDGKLVWEMNLGRGEQDYINVPITMAYDERSNSIFIAGYTLRTTGAMNHFVKRLDAGSGSETWNRTVRLGDDSFTQVVNIAVGSQGEIVSVGEFHGELTISDGIEIDDTKTKITNREGVYIIKWTADGNYEWITSTKGGRPTINGLSIANDGTILLAGGHSDEIQFDIDDPSSTYRLTQYTNLFLAALNQDGSLHWWDSFKNGNSSTLSDLVIKNNVAHILIGAEGQLKNSADEFLYLASNDSRNFGGSNGISTFMQVELSDGATTLTDPGSGDNKRIGNNMEMVIDNEGNYIYAGGLTNIHLIKESH
jgi:hypothetical protein